MSDISSVRSIWMEFAGIDYNGSEIMSRQYSYHSASPNWAQILDLPIKLRVIVEFRFGRGFVGNWIVSET